MIKRFTGYYRPHLKLFMLDMFCALIVAGGDLFYPMIAKNIINIYVPQRLLEPVMIWLSVMLGIFVIKYICNYIITYYGHIVGVRMQADMRKELFTHLQRLPFEYFDENKTGSIMSRLMNDLFEVSELAHHGPEDLFLSIVMFIGSFFILAGINLPLTLIVYAFVPVIVIFAVKMRTRMNSAFKRTREQVSEVNANVETAISGIRVSRAYTASENEINKFEAENTLYKKVRACSYKVMSQFHSGMTLFMDILYLVVLAAGGLFFFYGKIDIGEFTAYLLYISLLLNPIKRFVALFEQLQEGMTGFKRFTEIMDIPPEAETGSAVLTEPEGSIIFDNVSFTYASAEAESKTAVIDHLSMNIEKGRTVALVGPSGGGKTTLCNLIPRFYEISGGSISIDGTDIRDLTRDSLRRCVGIVAQDVFLFNGTVRENIAYGDLDASDERIIEAAKKADIHDYIMSLEHGYDTNVGERGIKLSGGQKQRISIARVFLKNPPILILDEATSALDNVTEQQIQRSLEELTHGRTVIVVAHRLSTVKNADEIIVLTHEGITERGTHKELMEKGGLYSTLYAYQFRD